MSQNELLALRDELLSLFPSLSAQVDEPGQPSGVWWLDLCYQEHSVVVQWWPSKGFGISAPLLPAGYGEGAEEVYQGRAEAKARLVYLLQNKKHTIPPREVLLRELRAMAGLTQEELAQHLGVQQAAISKMERRGNVTIALLRRYIEALGGKLAFFAEFGEERIPLGIEENDGLQAP